MKQEGYIPPEMSAKNQKRFESECAKLEATNRYENGSGVVLAVGNSLSGLPTDDIAIKASDMKTLNGAG